MNKNTKGPRKVGLTNIRYKTTLFRICVFLSVLMVITNAMISVVFANTALSIGNMQLPVSSLNGCIQVALNLFCTIMVLIDNKKGLVYSLIFLGISIFGSIRSAFMAHTLQPAPGTFNAILFVIALVLISKQIKYSNQMAVTDSVTGLLNRYGFDRDVRKMIFYNEKGHVVFIHLDGFWPVNANLGRKYGEELLAIVANRI